jgi:hypothetical protein
MRCHDLILCFHFVYKWTHIFCAYDNLKASDLMLIMRTLSCLTTCTSSTRARQPNLCMLSILYVPYICLLGQHNVSDHNCIFLYNTTITTATGVPSWQAACYATELFDSNYNKQSSLIQDNIFLIKKLNNISDEMFVEK